MLGSGKIPVYLDDKEITRIIAVISRDVGYKNRGLATIEFPADVNDYYDLPLAWLNSANVPDLDVSELFAECVDSIQDFETYFKCLCEIHKRRVKYERILSAQPLPKMLQVAPRALLEFGIIASPALASWLTWRKWFYDIDNRSAQETGYLFEPILANALGGINYGARNSPIRRRGDSAKGRQADCIVDRTAYEFKLRVTIAASGQGRFGEELDFAEDCRASGFVPVLLVLDPTPSHRLTDLTREYERVGGEAHIGDDAWLHLEEKAGPTMATFVEKYVRQPISKVDQYASELLDLSIAATGDKSSFRIELNNKKHSYSWTVGRHEDERLAAETEE